MPKRHRKYILLYKKRVSLIFHGKPYPNKDVRFVYPYLVLGHALGKQGYLNFHILVSLIFKGYA